MKVLLVWGDLSCLCCLWLPPPPRQLPASVSPLSGMATNPGIPWSPWVVMWWNMLSVRELWPGERAWPRERMIQTISRRIINWLKGKTDRFITASRPGFTLSKSIWQFLCWEVLWRCLYISFIYLFFFGGGVGCTYI